MLSCDIYLRVFDAIFTRKQFKENIPIICVNVDRKNRSLGSLFDISIKGLSFGNKDHTKKSENCRVYMFSGPD